MPNVVALEPNHMVDAPALQDGDRLGRAEFFRRWDAQPDLHFAERIEGIVHLMASPVSIREHASPSNRVGWAFTNYEMSTPGVLGFGAGTMLIDFDNDFQPDQALVILPEHGGRTRWSGKYLEGAPELAAEVSHTTAARDRGVKMEVYRRNGTREYLVWRTALGILDIHTLDGDGMYCPAPLSDGIWKSAAFPGLWLHPAALLANDHATLRATAEAGLHSPEHTAFVAELAARRAQ